MRQYDDTVNRDRKRGPLHVLGFIDWFLLNQGMRLRVKLSITFNGTDFWKSLKATHAISSQNK